MKLWGAIVEVNPKDLVVSLPGGLRGFVRVEDASDIFVERIKELVFFCAIFRGPLSAFVSIFLCVCLVVCFPMEVLLGACLVVCFLMELLLGAVLLGLF